MDSDTLSLYLTMKNSKFKLKYQVSTFNINERGKWVGDIYTWYGIHFS